MPFSAATVLRFTLGIAARFRIGAQHPGAVAN